MSSTAFEVDLAPRRHWRVALVILTVLVAMVALVWWHAWRSRHVASAPVREASTHAARPAAALARMNVQQLLSAARAAMHEQRLLAPVGDNAVALYLRVLHDDPHNRAAADALRELFPFAAQAAEQTINSGRFDDAQRQLDLLARVDPTNYTLTLLRAKLGERRRLAADEAASAIAPHIKPAATRVSRAQPTPAAVPSVASHSPSTPLKAAVATKPSPSPAAAVPSPAKPLAAVRTPPLLLRQVPPYYPADARRQHRQGWVDVSYTVEADGHVSHARVVRAQPRHLFDRAAVTAVERWRFKPGRLGGKAVSTQVTSRVDFHLPR